MAREKSRSYIRSAVRSATRSWESAMIKVGVLVIGLASVSTALVEVDAQIVVESPTMAPGRPIPRDHSPDGRNESPPLTWRGLPAGTRQLAVVCEDHGAGNPPPWVHWIVYNIPASSPGLPQGIPFDAADPMPVGLEGVRQGNNGWGLAMYRGPAPPAGAEHQYEFTVLALDSELDLPAGLTRAELLQEIEGHVLGRGTLTATYTRVPASAGAPLE
jgi:Raf kinase inhibitor-like YbhB/YbcL family protein